ncbi:MAG: hypothetical protein LBD94_02540 [Rickettsiales bacterium]|jgi:hypothetical protein|nr:hypothetical protein [Rickettsiales bacterium]
MEDRNARILKKLMPHICIAEWGPTDAETIMRDVIISTARHLPAISALPEFLPVLNNLAEDVKVFAFTADEKKIPEIAARKNVAIQLFAPTKKIENLEIESDIEIVLSLALKNTEHLDWNEIIFAGNKINASGFMFVDNNGANLHKLYDFLEIIGGKSAIEIHYCAGTNEISKLEAAYRLMEKVRPNMLGKLRLFVTRDFFHFQKSRQDAQFDFC